MKITKAANDSLQVRLSQVSNGKGDASMAANFTWNPYV